MISEIRKGIPVPEKLPRRSPKSKYGFSTMEVGDSFTVEIPEGRDLTVAYKTLYSAMHYWERTSRKKFLLRRTAERTYGVWRTE